MSKRRSRRSPVRVQVATVESQDAPWPPVLRLIGWVSLFAILGIFLCVGFAEAQENFEGFGADDRGTTPGQLIQRELEQSLKLPSYFLSDTFVFEDQWCDITINHANGFQQKEENVFCTDLELEAGTTYVFVELPDGSFELAGWWRVSVTTVRVGITIDEQKHVDTCSVLVEKSSDASYEVTQLSMPCESAYDVYANAYPKEIEDLLSQARENSTHIPYELDVVDLTTDTRGWGVDSEEWSFALSFNGWSEYLGGQGGVFHSEPVSQMVFAANRPNGLVLELFWSAGWDDRDLSSNFGDELNFLVGLDRGFWSAGISYIDAASLGERGSYDVYYVYGSREFSLGGALTFTTRAEAYFPAESGGPGEGMLGYLSLFRPWEWGKYKVSLTGDIVGDTGTFDFESGVLGRLRVDITRMFGTVEIGLSAKCSTPIEGMQDRTTQCVWGPSFGFSF